MKFGKITEEALAKARNLIDTERINSSMHPRTETHITKDYLYRFAHGIADTNPLYLDEEYAKNSRYGTLIAPPGWMTFMEKANGATDGFPGCHAIWRGAKFEWFLPVKLGDVLISKTYLREVREVPSKFAGGRAVIQAHETIATNQRGEVAGSNWNFWHRFERSGAKESSKYEGRQLARYTPEDIEKIKEDYKKEQRQGAEPRYWEDVEIGEEIPFVIKGPTTQVSKFAFESMMGPGGWFVGHSLAFQLFERHPGLPFVNEQGIPEAPVAIHWSNERCQSHLGLPGAYDAGYERNNWLMQMFMNWMGDDGSLKKLEVKYPDFALLGDTTWCHGRVTGKRVENGDHIVECEVWTVIKVDDIMTTTGTAEVILPSKAGK